MYEALNNVKTMSRASHRDQVNQAGESGKRGFKAKERGLRRCEGYMYREKGSAKLDRALGSLQSARAEHARNKNKNKALIKNLKN